MRLRAVKRVGNIISGWDGYGIWQDIRVSDRIAREVGESLCYVRVVEINL